MIKNKTAIILVVCLLLGLTFASYSHALLTTCGGFDESTGQHQPECKDLGDLIGTIRLIINFLLSWAWLVSVFTVVWQGIRMITARGNAETISTARDGLEYALIGFMAIMASFVILNLIVGFVTGGGKLDPNALNNAFNLVP